MAAAPPLVIDGPASASPRDTVVMVHGWPDTLRLWDGTVAVLADRYRCVRFTLPGFEAGDPRRARTLDEITALLRHVVRHAGGGQPVTLLLHDWGCFFGHHFAQKHPELVARIASVDIGDALSRALRAPLTARAKAMVVFYQWVLAIAWLVGGAFPTLGDRMARWMARQMHVRTAQCDIRGAMGYPYWILWSGAHGGYRAMRAFKPQVPIFFAYGQRKPFMFHSPAWAEALARLPGCRVRGFNAGHWVMIDASEEFHAELRSWLASN